MRAEANEEIGSFVRMWWAGGYSDLPASQWPKVVEAMTEPRGVLKTVSCAGAELIVKRSEIVGANLSTTQERENGRRRDELFATAFPDEDGKEPWE